MWPILIVILPPRLHEAASIGQPQKPVFVQAFVAEATVEALAVRVLHRLPRINEVQRDLILVSPVLQHVTDQLRTVVQDDLGGERTLVAEAVQDTHDPAPRQTRVNFEDEGFSSKDVNDAEEPDRPAGGQSVLEKIQCPLLVGALGRGWSPALDASSGFPSALAHRQAFLSIEPGDALVVDDDPLPPQQHLQAPVAEAGPVFGQLSQPGAHRVVIVSPDSIADARPG